MSNCCYEQMKRNVFMMRSKRINALFSIGMDCLLQRQSISLKADISQREFIAIDLLDRTEKVSCNDLSKRICLSVSRSSRIVDRLVHKGYLVRKTDPNNRRAVQVYLSPKGINLKRNIERLKKECEKKIFSGIDEQNLEIVEKGMIILQQSLRKYP